MQTITMTCETCHKVYQLDKTNELPAHVFTMHCNWCPACEDQAVDYYEEWWDEDERDPDKPPPIPDDPNQLCLPFIFDEMGVEKADSLLYILQY